MPEAAAIIGIGEAARILGVHPETLKRWCDRGDLPYIRLTPTSPRRFRRDDILALIEPHGDRAS